MRRGLEKCGLPTFVENVKFGEDVELLREVKEKPKNQPRSKEGRRLKNNLITISHLITIKFK